MRTFPSLRAELFGHESLVAGWSILGRPALMIAATLTGLSFVGPARPATIPVLVAGALFYALVMEFPDVARPLLQRGRSMPGLLLRTFPAAFLPSLWIAIGFGLPVVALGMESATLLVTPAGWPGVPRGWMPAALALAAGALLTPVAWGASNGRRACLHAFTGLAVGLLAVQLLRLPRLRDLPPADAIALGTFLIALPTLLPLAAAVMGWAVRRAATPAGLDDEPGGREPPLLYRPAPFTAGTPLPLGAAQFQALIAAGSDRPPPKKPAFGVCSFCGEHTGVDLVSWRPEPHSAGAQWQLALRYHCARAACAGNRTSERAVWQPGFRATDREVWTCVRNADGPATSDAPLPCLDILAADTPEKRTAAEAEAKRLGAAIRRGGRTVENLLARARVRAALGELAGALADCTAAVELDPASVDAWRQRAKVKLQRDGITKAWLDPHGAIADYSQALTLCPRAALIHSERAWARTFAGQDEAALGDCDAALALEPANGGYHRQRGWLLKDLGRPADAVRAFELSIQLDPDNRRMTAPDMEDCRAEIARVQAARPHRGGWFAAAALTAACGVLLLLAKTGRIHGVVWQQQIAAQFGAPDHAFALAWRHREGRGVPVDFDRHLGWLARSALLGSARGKFELGTCFYHGIGVGKDPARARALYAQAAKGGFAPAETMLGRIAMDADRDVTAALAYWQRAARRDPWAEYLLGAAYLRQRADDSRNLALALYWLERAKLHGVEPVQGLLAHVWATVPENSYERTQDWVFQKLEAEEKT